MIVLILLAFAGMLAGIFLLLGMTPFEFAEDLTKSFASREPPISKKIGQLNHPRGAKGIQKTVREAKEMMILTGAFIVIVGLQWWCRDLGSLPTFAAAYGCALACRLCYPKAKFSKKTIIGISAIAAILVALALRFAPGYVQDRLSVDIWNQMEGDGYQQCKALIAIAEGGLFGKGPGCGSLYKVFASDTDIVFSTICEEWGFLVALLSILILMAMMLLPMINKPRSYFHTTMILGCVAVLIVQMGLNIFGSCNLIPFTGVTIPFISQGGSSMITSGFLAGMLKAGQSPVFKKPEPKKKKARARKAVAAA